MFMPVVGDRKGMGMTTWLRVIACLIVAGYVAGCATLAGTWAGDAQELTNIDRVALACLVFASDHGNMWPTSTADLAPYQNEPGHEFDLSRVELVAKGSLLDEKHPTTSVLVRSTNVSTTGKRAVAFVDGHSELLPED